MLPVQTIGVKEFRNDFKKIVRATKRGQSFVVTSHKEPLFRIEPPQKEKKRAAKTLLEEFGDLQFHSGQKDLSKRIDEIVYADRR